MPFVEDRIYRRVQRYSIATFIVTLAVLAMVLAHLLVLIAVLGRVYELEQRVLRLEQVRRPAGIAMRDTR